MLSESQLRAKALDADEARILCGLLPGLDSM
jgi:hypothetical protein